MNEEEPIESTIDRSSGILIPCPPEDFGDFISGLLGSPQTIEKSIINDFVLGRADVRNLFHLLKQRVEQQNEATLIQFNVKIIYDDRSSVLLNGFTAFDQYQEVKPLESVGIVLSWIYLIEFKNKPIPEKQSIDISFLAGTNSYSRQMEFDDELVVFRPRTHFGGGIEIRINHTDRTWGVDVESLLTGHIKGLVVSPSKSRAFFSKHSGLIGTISGTFFFVLATIGLIIGWQGFEERGLESLVEFDSVNPSFDDRLMERLTLLVEAELAVGWERISTLLFSAVSLVIAIAIGSWVSDNARRSTASFVLVTKAAIDSHETYKERQKNEVRRFAGTFVVAIAGGLIANLLFTQLVRLFS